MIYIHPNYSTLFNRFRRIDDFLDLDVTLVRDFKNRKTGHFEIDGKRFYIKKHFECGWSFVLDELFHLRKPHIGAGHEWSVLNKLRDIGIDTLKPVAFGQKGSATRQQSFLITEALMNTKSMAKVCEEWPTKPPTATYKRSLLRKIADTAKKIHEHGINHRDFYLCHFLLDTADLQAVESEKQSPILYLVDLHRAQQRNEVPFRWRVKDIGGLYFSAMDIGLNRTDLLRFMCLYTGKSLRRTLTEERRFWKAVQRRAIRIYRRDFGRNPEPRINTK